MIDDPAFATAAAGSGMSQPMVPPLPPESAVEAQAAGEQSEAIAGAFAARPGHWRNIPLAPFAISREGDWRMHRQTLGCPALEDLITDPQSMIPDAIRVIWFLTHEPAEWLSVSSMEALGEDDEKRWVRRSAFEMAMEVETKIRDWADEWISSAEHMIAVTLFYDVFNGTRETRTSINPDKHHDPERAKK